MVSRSTPFDPRFAVKQRLGFGQRLGFLVLSVTTNPNPTCTTSVEKLHNGYDSPGHEKNTFSCHSNEKKTYGTFITLFRWAAVALAGARRAEEL
jgi:hypothetical protein